MMVKEIILNLSFIEMAVQSDHTKYVPIVVRPFCMLPWKGRSEGKKSHIVTFPLT